MCHTATRTGRQAEKRHIDRQRARQRDGQTDNKRLFLVTFTSSCIVFMMCFPHPIINRVVLVLDVALSLRSSSQSDWFR